MCPKKISSDGDGDPLDRSISRVLFGLPTIDVIEPQSTTIYARASDVQIGRLTLAEMKEDVPLLAWLNFPKGRVFVSFPTGDSEQSWDGVKMWRGAVIFHAPGSRIRWRSSGWSSFGCITFTAADFDEWSRILLQRRLPRSKTRLIISPSSKSLQDLLRLHSDVIRISEGEENVLAHPEIVRSLEDELIVALMMCLSESDGDHFDPESAERARALGTAEDFVLRNPHRILLSDELGDAVGIPKRKLAAYSRQLVQLPIGRYLRLLREAALAKTAGGGTDRHIREKRRNLH